MNSARRSYCNLQAEHETTEQRLLSLIFSNSDIFLLSFLELKSPLCKYSWIKAQELISLASSLPYHKSYYCLLKYFSQYSLTGDSSHSQLCPCMSIDINRFNTFGITPFLKSLPCSFDILKYQVEIGADIILRPRCPLFAITSPLFSYMKHLVDQVYDQKMDAIEVDKCVRYVCSLGIEPNDVPPNVSTNIMVLYSIAADITVQSDFENQRTKFVFLDYLDRILENLLSSGLDSNKHSGRNKLSYELHGDGLFDFIFMLKYPSDNITLAHIAHWILLLVQHGSDPDVEMRSKCRDLLKFKLLSDKPNNALSVFYFIIHEMFDDDFVDSVHIRHIDRIITSLTSQIARNKTVSFFRKSYPDSAFIDLFSHEPPTLKSLSRYVLVSSVLGHRPVDIDLCDVPIAVADYVRYLQ